MSRAPGGLRPPCADMEPRRSMLAPFSTANHRIRFLLDERRYRDFAKTPAGIFYHWQPQLGRR